MMDLPISEWIEFGAFGVLACGCFWTMFRGFPRLMSVIDDRVSEMLHRSDVRLDGAIKTFVNEIHDERAARNKMHSEHLETVKMIGESCHDAQRALSEIMERNREALIRVETTLDHLHQNHK